MTPLFAFTADWHQAPGAWSNRPEIQDDSYFAVDYLVSYCLAERLPLIDGGDTFDKTTPDSGSVVRFCRQLDRLQAAGIPYYFVQGNHDYRPEPWASVHGWPQHLHNRPLDLGGFVITGLDSQPAHELPRALELLPANTQVLVAHQRWREYGGGEAAEGSIGLIPHATYLLTGDYHECRMNTWPGKTGQRICCLSPGAICLQATNEPAEHYFWVAGLENGQLCFTARQIPSRPKYTFRFDQALDFENFLTHPAGWLADSQDPSLWPQLRKPLVVVYYRDDIEEAYPRLKQLIGGQAHLFTYPIHIEENVVVDVEALQLPDDPAAALVSVVEQLAPLPEVAVTGRRLLAAQNLAVELDTMLQERLTAAAAAEGVT